jgi:hypothetical protein
MLNNQRVILFLLPVKSPNISQFISPKMVAEILLGG